MSIWDFDETGSAELQRSMDLDAPPGLPEVGAFDRLGASVTGALGRGVVHLGEMAYNVGGLGIAGYEMVRDHIGSKSRAPSAPKPGDLLRPYQQITRTTTRRLLDSLTPNPETTGEASQVLGAVGEIVVPLLAGLGNPAPLVSAQINSAQDRLERLGADPMTARRGALTEGAIFALGARIPVLGNGLATRVGTGILGNTALGVGGRAVESQVLADYPEIAAQMDPTDPKLAAIDAALGALFGGYAHAVSPRAPGPPLPRPVADAAATLANARHADVDTAPGVPATPAAAAAHRRSLEQKMLELMYDQPQAIDPAVIDAEFTPRAVDPDQAQLQREWDEAYNEQAALQREWDAAMGTTPEAPIDNSVPGELQGVSTATGRRIGVDYQVVELDTLVTSDRPEYPGELQPRDRSRVAMQDQVQNIAATLDPAQLGRSPVADTGAPIVGPDFVVESGNGRTMALRRAYDVNGPRAQAYRDFLQAEGFRVDGMRRPVLVRVRRSELTPAERVAFTEEANVPTTATMSASERAGIEARAIDDAMLSLVDGADYASARNAPFVAAFLAKLPVNLRNELVTDDGRVSLTGIKRIQAAMMTRAYGGSAEAQAVLERALESPQSDVRSIIAGMLEAAPAFAKLRAEIAAGRVAPEVDIGERLGRAVAEVQAIRDRRGSVAEYLAQRSMLDSDAVDAQIKQLVSMFYNGERAASGRKIAERLTAYADQALAQRLDQQSMFGPPEPDVIALVEQAKNEAPIYDENDLTEAQHSADEPVAVERIFDDALGLDPRVAEDPLPRVDSQEVVYSGAAGIRTRVVAEGKPLYREVNADGLYDLILLDDGFHATNIFVTDNPDLAIGQGLNTGVKVRLRANAASGREHAKPATGDIAGREYLVDALAPNAIEAVTFPRKLWGKLRGLVKVRLQRSFDMTDNGDGTVTFKRRGSDVEGRVREEMPEFGMTVRAQLDLFPDLQIARVKAIRAANALATPPPVAKGKPSRPYSVLGNALSSEFKATGTASLLGHTVSSPHDLARLIEAYRDPRFETFRMYFTDVNGEIVHQTGVSGRIPGAASVIPDGVTQAQYLQEVITAARNGGAVRWWMSHNHPSGSVDASQADKNVTLSLKRMFDQLGWDYGGHVISDTDHYNALEYNVRGNTMDEAIYPKAGGWARKYDTKGAPVLDHPMLGTPLRDMAGIHNVFTRLGTGPVMVGRGAKGDVKFIAEVDIGAMSLARFRALIRKSARASGSVDVLFGNIRRSDRDHLLAAHKDGWILDAMYPDGTTPAWLPLRKPASPKARSAVREDDAPYMREGELPPDSPDSPELAPRAARVAEALSGTGDERRAALLDYLDGLVSAMRRENPDPVLEAMYFDSRLPDPDRGAARYIERQFEALPEPVRQALYSENVRDLETGETLNALEDGVRGGHIAQLRRAVEDAALPFGEIGERTAPYVRGGRVDTVARGRIRRTVASLVKAAESQSGWRTWYERHDQTLADLFGDDAELFQRMLSATSQATNVAGNVSLALKAYGQWMRGEPFTGYLPAVIRNLERVRDDLALQGAKISQYGEANAGNVDAIAVDRHIAELLFNTKRPSRAQIEAAKARIGKVADTLGWEPRQVQAALWAFNQVRKGSDPSKVASYDTILETRAEFIAELRSRHGRAEGTGVPPGLDPAAGAAEGAGRAEAGQGAEVAAASRALAEHAALPEVQAAHEVLAVSDFQVPTGRLLSSGKPETNSARAMLEKAEQAIVAAENDGKGFDAAAACALQGI